MIHLLFFCVISILADCLESSKAIIVINFKLTQYSFVYMYVCTYTCMYALMKEAQRERESIYYHFDILRVSGRVMDLGWLDMDTFDLELSDVLKGIHI